ncbi:MAG: transglutaminase family protein [Anaerolineae bacterium]|nr:transglutaminase family protein [Anaerolineae bacterium]
MKYRIIHKTEYVYDEPASLCYNEARLAPRSLSLPMFEQICLNWRITVDPPYNDYRERTDFFGNNCLYFTVPETHEEMIITATSEVQIDPVWDKDHTVPRADLLEREAKRSPAWEVVRNQLQTDLFTDSVQARQFVMNSPLVVVTPEIAAYAAPSFDRGRPLLEAVYDLMQRIYFEFDFVSGVTTIATPLAEVIEKRRGVCQDFAHLMVACLRAKGLAARYVSGYIETLPPPGEEKLEGADASHAWCSVFVPGPGWIDFDPTNNLIPKDQHIVLGWGRDFSDVTPLKGVFFSHGKHKLQVEVDVTRVQP